LVATVVTAVSVYLVWHPLPWPYAVRDVPLLVPGAVVSLVVGIAFRDRVGRALGGGPAAGATLVFGLGVILAATLTPLNDSLRGFQATPAGPCHLGRIGPPAWEELLTVGDTSLNVLLFIPLGAAIGLLPRSRRQGLVILGAIALPFVIETIQMLVPALRRECESADVGDNLTGLLIGVVIGTVASWLTAMIRGRDTGRAR
jgi:hypothetical protein